MSNWLYPEAIARVESACNLFISGDLDINGLQASLYQSELEIEAIEESWFRSLLSDTENKLEEIKYLMPCEEHKAAMRDAIEQLLSRIHGRGKASG